MPVLSALMVPVAELVTLAVTASMATPPVPIASINPELALTVRVVALMPTSPAVIVLALLTVTATPDTATPVAPSAEIVPELLMILMMPLLDTAVPLAPVAVMLWALFNVTRLTPRIAARSPEIVPVAELVTLAVRASMPVSMPAIVPLLVTVTAPAARMPVVPSMKPAPLVIVALVLMTSMPATLPKMVAPPALPDALMIALSLLTRMPTPDAPVARIMVALLMIASPERLIPIPTPVMTPVFEVRLRFTTLRAAVAAPVPSIPPALLIVMSLAVETRPNKPWIVPRSWLSRLERPVLIPAPPVPVIVPELVSVPPPVRRPKVVPVKVPDTV